VGVRRHVGGNASDGDGDISAVIEIEATQIVLVCFSFTGVLRNDDARHRLKQFTGPQDRAHFQFSVSHVTFSGRIGLSQKVFYAATRLHASNFS
jgi:hypothetical protein